MSELGFTKKGKPRNKGMFQPGVSGNPKGRPKKDYRITELARTYSATAVFMLIDIMMDPHTKDDDRIRAMDIILNRAYGKW